MKRLKNILLVSLFAFAAGITRAEEVIKIGAIFSLSGPSAVVGEQFRDGALLRMKEQEAAPALFKYEISFEDDANTPKNSVLAYRKLARQCDAIFNCWAGPGNVIAPLAAKDKKLVIGSAWDSRIAADALAFLHLTPPEPQAKLVAETLAALGVKRVAVLCVVQQGFMAMEKEFAATAATLGLQTQTVKFNPGEIDFRGHLLKVREFEPEAYLVLTFQPEFEILYRRIKEEAPRALITAVEGFVYLDDLTPYEGNFFVDGNNPTAAFRKKYQAETGKPYTGFIGNGYDMVDLVIYAYETAGARLGRKPTTEEAAEVLRNLKDYPGAIGALTMGENRVIESPATLKYIENGAAKIVTLEELKQRLGK